MIDVTVLCQAMKAALEGAQELSDAVQLPVLLTVVGLEGGAEHCVASVTPMAGQLPLFLGPDL
jgi:hypothetical protein